MRVCGASDVPAAVNATVFAAGGLVWTSGCLTLAHVLFRARPLALLTAAALAGGFVAFPFNLLSWGVLYSNYLAICLLPSLLAAAGGPVCSCPPESSPREVPGWPSRTPSSPC